MTQEEIARAFSNGRFELTYPFLADDAKWTIIGEGENEFEGKQAIIDNCEQTAAYFKSVTTKFETLNCIADVNRVAVNGTAAFIRNNKQVAFISACDVYEFNDENKLESITSYCIRGK